MPPKAKYTREEIIEIAFQMARENVHNAFEVFASKDTVQYPWWKKKKNILII